MSSLMRPVGPQQPGVYWFRRALVVIVVVVIFAGIGYLLFGRGSGNSPSTQPTPGTSATPHASPSRTPSPSAKPTATPSAKPSGSTKPSATPRPSGSASTTGIRACSNSDITLVASTDKSTYASDATPELQMRITNSSSSACRRNVGAAANELLVYQGSTRFWSSDDCSPGGSQSPVTIAAGQSYSVTVTWQAIGSSPGCPTNPPKATAGSYSLVGVNQTERTKAANFSLS